MAESLRQLKLLGDPLNLDGLEPLLELGYVELVREDTSLTPARVDTAPGAVSETRLILDLMTQVELVNELVLETSFKLQKAHESLLSMEREIYTQDLRLERMKDLESKIVELETWLEAAVAENTSLKRPWYKRLFKWRY